MTRSLYITNHCRKSLTINEPDNTASQESSSGSRIIINCASKLSVEDRSAFGDCCGVILLVREWLKQLPASSVVSCNEL